MFYNGLRGGQKEGTGVGVVDNEKIEGNKKREKEKLEELGIKKIKRTE